MDRSHNSDSKTLLKRKASISIVGFGTAYKVPEKSQKADRFSIKTIVSAKKMSFQTPKGKSTKPRLSEPASFLDSTARCSDQNLSLSMTGIKSELPKKKFVRTSSAPVR